MVALDAWIKRIQDASDRGKAPHYSVYNQNCATFCIAGLIQGNAIKNQNISIIPNLLFLLLSDRAAQTNPPQKKKEDVKSQVCFFDEHGQKACQ